MTPSQPENGQHIDMTDEVVQIARRLFTDTWPLMRSRRPAYQPWENDFMVECLDAAEKSVETILRYREGKEKNDE